MILQFGQAPPIPKLFVRAPATDATSVVARLSYVRRDGVVDTEDRWLSVVSKSGRLVIYDSERIGPA